MKRKMSKKYILLEVEENVERVVCKGTAQECLLAAANKMSAIEISHTRMFSLPQVHRQVGVREAKDSGLKTDASS